MNLPPTTQLPSIEILLTDPLFLVLNKPALVHSVRSDKSDHISVVDWLEREFPECLSASANPNEGGLVHRLDFETSGALIVARSREVWDAFREQFQSGGIEKEYLVLLDNDLKESRSIEGFIGTDARRGKKVYFSVDSRDRYLPATASFEPVSRLGERSLARVHMQTGRRHQVRVMARWMGHTLSGDTLYGSNSKFSGESSAPPFFLHASRLVFRSPATKEPLSVDAPLPQYASHLLEHRVSA